ncbi:MAG: endolytic transglycosylase MltG [Rhodospirillales bacterium]
MGHTLKTAAAVLAVLAAAGAGGAWWGHDQFTRPGPSTADITVIIERGAGIDGIAGALARAGVLEDPLVFRIAARWITADNPLKAGEYAFAAGISARGALELLQSGKTVVRRLTVIEGLTTAEIVAQLQTTEGLTGLVTPAPPEGGLLPETYHFSFGDRRRAIIGRMRDAMDALMANLWRNKAPGVALQSPREALILASIVEKETAVPAERPRIAAVFLNRLARGMRLQSDPTVVYGLTQGRRPLGRPLGRDDLKAPSPYNTYLIDGLPPGPICNPGSASLEAVLRPGETDDLYFVADGSGGHVFAATLAEHNRNVAKWRRLNKETDGRR